MILLVKNKPLRYFIGLGVVFVLFELFLMASPTVFSNLTERINLKSAMFQFRDTTQVLFLGSSRFKDGISPKLVSKAIQQRYNTQINAFNGALTGTNIQKLEIFFNRSVAKPGLDLVVIEVSYPHLAFDENFSMDEKPAESFEEELQNGLIENVKLAAWRKSFRIENFIKSPAILFADYLEGSELYRAHLVKDFLDNTPYQYTAADHKLWQPLVIEPNQPMGDDGGDCVMHVLQDIVKLSKKNEVDLLFVIPPLVNDRKEKETNEEAMVFYQNVANKTGCSILNYGALDIPEAVFADQDSHMNKEGRHLFSHAIAEPIANYFLNQ